MKQLPPKPIEALRKLGPILESIPTAKATSSISAPVFSHILEIEFICLNKVLIDKVKKLFNECKIDVKKIVSFDYAKKFLNNIKDDTLCLSAYEILNDANRSEVILTENTSEKYSLFDKVFNFLDK